MDQYYNMKYNYYGDNLLTIFFWGHSIIVNVVSDNPFLTTTKMKKKDNDDITWWTTFFAQIYNTIVNGKKDDDQK